MPHTQSFNDPQPSQMSAEAASRLRLAVLSTPRSGNTWLRHLLAHVYSARELAVHNPADLDWQNLPENCVLQIHWHRTPAFQALLQEHGFGLVVLARHPLDVMLSILHYALHDSSPQRWLEGEAGNEASICGAMPCSSAFLKYATSQRAGALLSISREWWDVPQACKVHYERLVGDPLAELTRIVEAVGVPARQPLAEAVATFTLGNLRSRSGTQDVPESDHHYWQGKPGHWKRLLSCQAAYAIAAAQAEAFSTFDYECDPDASLDDASADANWIELNRRELTTRLWNYTPMKQQLEPALHRAVILDQRCAELEMALENRAEALAAVEYQRAQLQAALDNAYLVIQKLSRAPSERVAALVKRLLRV